MSDLKIAYISAGAGGMLCGSCLHDNALAAALVRRGHDVTLIPTYTPLRTDDEDVSIDRVFYGAVNVYLEQKTALFRHTPWMIDRLLANRGLLNWVVKRGSSSTNARELGEITLSVLLGEEGKQKKELERLVGWLRDSIRPDIVHLTNSMFVGMARELRRELGVPVLCSVQGEDIFLDDLEEPHRQQVRETLWERARDVDGFVAPSRYYVDFMADYLRVPAEKFHLVPLGLHLSGYGDQPVARDAPPFTVGFLARICPEKGLHLLVDAFHEMAQQAGKEQLRLRVAGYVTERDRPYLDGIRDQIRRWGLEDQVDLLGEIDRGDKIRFLSGLHVLSVPTTYREPKGLFILEAMANGIPVVQPRHGAFPELIEATGGGVLVEPGSTVELARELRALMDDPERRRRLGEQGKQAVHREFSDDVMAEKTLKLYRSYVDNRDAARGADA
jgi:glycosyltransferase involved in cell wall biosynthesis